MAEVIRAGLVTLLVISVFAVAATILLGVVGALLYGGIHEAWDVMHGWRGVVCPPTDRLAGIQVRSRKVVACSVFGGRQPTCANPCVLAGAHAK